MDVSMLLPHDSHACVVVSLHVRRVTASWKCPSNSSTFATMTGKRFGLYFRLPEDRLPACFPCLLTSSSSRRIARSPTCLINASISNEALEALDSRCLFAFFICYCTCFLTFVKSQNGKT
jgi:hypothetical protein